MRKAIHPLPPMRSARSRSLTMAAIAFAAISLGATTGAQAKPFMDYIKPMPIVAPLSSATWGVAGVLPRDLSNGIESAKGAAVPPEWHYWDGQIIRAKDGKYHLFHSTWLASAGFNPGWTNSDAYHSISEQGVLGPYTRKDYVYTNGGSHKGHNVTALELQDGSYAVVVGEVVPLAIYKSTSLDGPWTACSPNSQIGGSNVSIIQRHDGKFQAVERNGTIAISDTLCGTYVKQKPTCSYTQNPTDAQGNPVVGSVYAKRTSIPNVPSPSYLWQEDPHIWRSGGVYHVIYSGSGDRVGWHVYSVDGLTNWKDNGYAWSPREYAKIFCYEGSTTCNQWYKMERPSVVLQDGHPTHLTWAVADVDKDNQIPGGSNHGSKIIVIPFDGVAFDNDFGVGGSSGTGGANGTGGSNGTGGATGSGGRDGGMGGTGSGGAIGTGGRSGSDGGLGGSGSSGATGGLGGTNSGGATSTGGRLGGTGGATVVASGGSGGSGGAGTGGVTAGSGGVTGTGGSGTGGTMTGTGGSGSGAGGQGGGNSSSTGSSPKPDGTPDSGCACKIQGREKAGGRGGLLLLGFILLSRVHRRRSAQETRHGISTLR